MRAFKTSEKLRTLLLPLLKIPGAGLSDDGGGGITSSERQAQQRALEHVFERMDAGEQYRIGPGAHHTRLLSHGLPLSLRMRMFAKGAMVPLAAAPSPVRSRPPARSRNSTLTLRCESSQTAPTMSRATSSSSSSRSSQPAR
jgi:hypothetical protein